MRLASACVGSLGVMAEDRARRLDLAKLLVAVENAPPVAAADVVGEWLEEALGAFDVSFLVVDFSGRALIRLGHAGIRAAAVRRGGRLPSVCRWKEARTGARYATRPLTSNCSWTKLG